jgi:flagellar basal-body rod protein FlgG
MLFESFYVSATGAQAASSFLDATSNNVANTNTTGYKTAQTSFQDLLYSGLLPGVNSAGITPPGGIQFGAGAVVSAETALFTQGPIQPTGNPFDLAINGEGFFRVTLPDGTFAYTRDGSLGLDSAGNLVTSDGFKVDPPIVVPTGSTATIGADGTVTATAADGTQTAVGQVGLTRFINPAGLIRIGQNLFAASASSGTASDGFVGDTNGFGTLLTGNLEGSNVDLTTELVNLLIAQRTFTFNTQAITVESDLLAATANLVQ